MPVQNPRIAVSVRPFAIPRFFPPPSKRLYPSRFRIFPPHRSPVFFFPPVGGPFRRPQEGTSPIQDSLPLRDPSDGTRPFFPSYTPSRSCFPEKVACAPGTVSFRLARRCFLSLNRPLLAFNPQQIPSLPTIYSPPIPSQELTLSPLSWLLLRHLFVHFFGTSSYLRASSRQFLGS